jgi:hypothetical protein
MRTRLLHAAAFALAGSLLTFGASADPPAPPALSREISPAPPRAMHRASSAGWFVLGVSSETVRAVSASSAGWSVTGGVWGDGVSNAEGLSMETAFAAAIGGGQGGVQGQLDARLLYGWRGYVTDWQGPFVRVGVDGRQFGSYLSSMAVPAGVAGYELVDGRVAFDVGVHGAFAESASFSVYSGGSRDVSDSPVLGAYAWMIAHPIRAELRWDRLWPHNQEPLGHAPIDDVGASACITAGRSMLILCASADIVSGPATVPAASGLFATTAILQSVSVGLGSVGSRAVAP